MLPLLVSLALASSAGAILYHEARPYFVSGISVQARITAILSGDLQPGLSFESQRIVLDDCYVAMNSLLVRAGPTSKRLQLSARCAELADGVTKIAPTSAYAFFILAVAAVARGDADAFNANLARSQQLAPREAWLADVRVRLGEPNLDLLDERAAEGQNQDIGLLASSGRYGEYVIERYLADAGFRQRLESILAALSDQEKSRFILLADTALKAKGS